MTKEKRNHNYLSTDDVHIAYQLLIIKTQDIHFIDEVSDIKAGKQIKSTSKLSSLSPFVDKCELLRMGGRIQNLLAPHNRKHPILLPSDGKFTILLFKREHH